jgi:hypothetical protein
MRQALGLGVALLLVATGEGRAAGNQPFCLQGLWTPTGNMSTPRADHAAALLPSGKVLVSGGFFGSLVATAELYDLVTGTWSSTGSMSVPRFFHTMTLLPTGKVLVAGGAGLEDTSAELYDPDTGQWTTTGAMLDARSFGHTATLLSTGKVLVVGGLSRNGVAGAELYDPATGQWHATGTLSNARSSHSATLLASGQVLVVGGDTSGVFLSSAEVYDPATGTWTAVAPMLAARAEHTATLLPSGAVLVAGGDGAPMEAELYDPVSGTWRRTGSLSAPHSVGVTATRLASGRVLVVGGAGGPFAAIANTELFDPASETWSDAGCTGEARGAHTATLLLSGAVLVAGGNNSTGQILGSAELYGIFVSPEQVSLGPGASQTFTARGGSGLGYLWSFVQNKSGGTLTASGVYQAGPMGGVADVVQVVDSLANSTTATVDVIRQPSALSATSSQANSMGCATGGGTALPSPGGAVPVLLGCTLLRRARRSTGQVLPTSP